MERLNELLAILGDEAQRAGLSDEDLASHEAELLALFDAIRDGAVEDVARDDTDRLRSIVDAVTVIRDEAAARIDAAVEREAEVAGMEALLRPVAEDDEDEATEVEDDEAPAPEAIEEVIAEAEAATEEAAEVEVVTAAAPALRSLAQARPKSTVPVVTRSREPHLMVPGGESIPFSEIGRVFADRHDSFAGFAGGGIENVRVGRFDYRDQYGDDRTLHATDGQMVIDRKVESLCASAMLAATYTDPAVQALVASGGFCAPTPAQYDLAQISGAQRPVRDSLPSFQVDRGGIRFTTPPDLGDVLVSQAGGAVGVWDNDTDTTPGESVKTTQTIDCGNVVEVLTQAIYRSVQYGNFGARAYPEWFSTWASNVLAAQARLAEQELLDSIDASSTPVTTGQVLGATRDLLSAINKLAVAERNRQRMAPDTRLRVLLPAWVVGLMQMDQINEGYNRVTDPITEQTIRGWLSTLGINAAFYEDSRTGASQVVAAQGAGNDMRELPFAVEWYLFHEGAHVFLDGGTLDLGLVRDSTLNETNDLRMFAESWEASAYRGIFSYRVRSTVCPEGSGGQVAAGPCDASS